ncbi:hypothetical protein [Streptomyces sp. NPDC001970]
MPTAVAVGYLREPEMDLPMPGPDFAHRINTLLTAAANHPAGPSRLPTRQDGRERDQGGAHSPTRHPSDEAVQQHIGETATR